MSNLLAFVKRFRVIAAFAAFLIAGGLVYGTIRMTRPGPKLPLAEVQKKEFVDYVEVRGEVKALHFVTVTAPAGAGDLQILKIATNGAKVKKGDPLVEFDATTVEQKKAQDASLLRSAEAEIQQSAAAAKLKEEQDLTDVMKARFTLESAKMDASRQEILSEIDGAEARLKQTDAQQKVKEAEIKLKADRTAATADLEITDPASAAGRIGGLAE
jgi:HlyD family secretion protein